MTDPPIQRLEAVFQAAADLPPEARSAFLDDRLGADPATRAKVEAMLQALDKGDSLEVPAVATAAIDEGPGTWIDRYKLLQVIGEGGFGIVYMAEQEEPVRRKVALKVIKLGMDTKEVVARFEAERQALAMMDHPNIAKVLDGGATATGRPYFVMELVHGVAITEYCDTHRVGTEERLQLFEQVCHAVQHAHQKGILHRDIKPSNVMITLHDGTPVPKVIDFGIAKAMHTRLTEKTLFTEYQRFLGTPAYMSPEQAEMSGLDIDTRTDVYSLGVLLYELLTGSTPFDAERLMRAGVSEIQRIIREEEPPRPSLRISTSGQQAIAESRNLDLQALTRTLRGDLDWIVMKALAKERVRRYGTASELAADVQRHRENAPVHAGPPSAWYRWQKFLARNRAAVFAGAAVLGVLVLGIIGTGFALLQASAERDNARLERDHAQVTLDFLIDTMSLTDPRFALKPSITVQELLDGAVERVPEVFCDQPAAQARILGTIGRAYASMGEHGKADRHLRRAADLFAADPDCDPIEHFTMLWALTSAAFSLDASDAYAVARRTFLVGHAHLEETDPKLAGFLRSFYTTIQEPGDSSVDRAFALADAAEAAAAAGLAAEDPAWAIVGNTFMAGGYSMWHRPREAESVELFEKALRIQRRTLAPNHPDIGATLGMIAGVYNRAGKPKLAESYIREALQLLRRVHGPDNFQVGFTESVLGASLVLQGKFEEAERVLIHSHEIILDSWGEQKFHAVDARARILDLYDEWGRPDKAAPHRTYLRRFCASNRYGAPWRLVRTAFSSDEHELLTALQTVQDLTQGVYTGVRSGSRRPTGIDAAVREVERAWRRRATAGADEHLAVIVGRLLLGWEHALDDGFAVPTRRRMVELAAELLGPTQTSIPTPYAIARSELARFLATEDRETAIVMAREASALLAGSKALDNWWNADEKARAALAWAELGLRQEAEPALLTARTTIHAQLGPDHQDARAIDAELVAFYTAWGRPAEAAAFR